MRGALSLNPTYYEALKRLTLELAGVNLGSDHAFLIETRLATLARQEGYESLDDMVEELFNTGQSRLAVKVVSSLLERDTHFYTDRPSFDKLENIILPALYAKYYSPGSLCVPQRRDNPDCVIRVFQWPRDLLHCYGARQSQR